jgi:molybdopterin molybdotransferase
MTTPTDPPHADVRMRGFARRTTVAAALEWLDAQLLPLEAERVPLASAAGRVLAAPVASAVDVPGFDRSMMDGFAVRASDVAGASVYNPIPLAVVGEAFPGRPFGGAVGPGQAVRIMTGAPLPAGADAVLPAELTELEGSVVRAHGEVSTPQTCGCDGRGRCCRHDGVGAWPLFAPTGPGSPFLDRRRLGLLRAPALREHRDHWQ